MKVCLLVFVLFLQDLCCAKNCDTLEIKKLNSESALQLLKDVNLAYKLANESVQKSKHCASSRFYYESVLALSKVFYQKDQPDSIVQLISPILKRLDSHVNSYHKAALNHKLSSAYTMIMQLELGLKQIVRQDDQFE